ncbi:unnamed protein product [Musa acuminata subsp. burmannicoides]
MSPSSSSSSSSFSSSSSLSGRLESEVVVPTLSSGLSLGGASPVNKKAAWALEGWGFSLRWLDQVIKNSYPGLSNDEYKQLGCLKEILSTSRVVMGITESGWSRQVLVRPPGQIW